MLLSNLNLLATAPSGVARLRELILTLAVQGKLVPQDPSDEPASELLKKIRAEKDRLMAEGKIKRDKPLAEIAEEEKPFELPKGWEWTRWSYIAMKIGDIDHKMPAEVSDGVPYVSPRDFYGKNEIDFSGAKKIAHSDFLDLASKIRPEKGDLIYPRYGTIGVIRLVMEDREFLASYSCAVIKVLRGFIEPSYQCLVAMSDCVKRQAASATNKTTQPNVGLKSIQEYLVPLPPLAEQSRIVTRVEELMRLCDALEAKGQLEAAQHAQLVSTLLATLTTSETPEQTAQSWQRVATHFDLLLDRPEAIDALEQTILQLAVRGLLVPQNPQDEPASALLKKIRTEKDQLIQQGKIKRDKPLPPIADDEKPFELPEGWEWVRLGEIVLISSGVTLGRKTPIPSPVSLPYLRVANVQRWHLNLTSMKEVFIDKSELGRFQLANGDLLITEGGDWDKVGRTAIWRDELPSCLHQNHVFKARGTSREWNAVWAEMYLNSTIARTYFASSAKQTTNLASINMSQLKDCLFPLPPLAEQSRIVARVTELRQLCARLRSSLAQAQDTQQVLAQALVEELA